MEVGLRLWLCILLSFAMICYARNTISFSGQEMPVVLKTPGGRSLQVSLDDYACGPAAAANDGHEPSFGAGGGGGNDGHSRRRGGNP